MDTSNPIFQAIIAPFAVAFVVVGASRLIGGRSGSALLAGLGVAGALLLALALLRGVPPFPPNSSPEKLFYLIVLAGALGLALDLAGRPQALERLAILAFPAIGLVWLDLRQLLAGPERALLIELVLLWLGGAVVLWRLRDAAARNGLTAAILVIATAIGVAAVAALAPFMGLALASAAVGAAMGALAIWAYGTLILGGTPMTIGATALFAAAGGLVVMVQLLVLFTPAASKPAAAFLVIVPFSGLVAERLPLDSGVIGRILGPILQGAIAAVPVLATIGLAYLLPDD